MGLKCRQSPPPPPPPPPPLPPPSPTHPTPAPPALNVSLSNRQTCSRGDIVVFGESGSAKSSVINSLAQKPVANTSSDATGSTFSFRRYGVAISGQRFDMLDVAGFNEGTVGTVPVAKAEENMKSLLHELTRPESDGISLLVYCVRSTRACRTLARNYDIFYSAICRRKVPIVIVFTGLENEPDTSHWSDAKEKELRSCGMHFSGYACVTTLQKYSGIPDAYSRRIEESPETLRNLIVNNSLTWAADSSCFGRSFADVRCMMSDSWSSKRPSPSILIICDSQNKEIEITHVHDILQTSLASIGGNTYRIHRVLQPQSASGVGRKLEGDLLVYHVHADERSTARQNFRAFSTLYHGNMVPVVVVVKGLNDSNSAHQWVEQHIVDNRTGRLFSTFAPAINLGDDSVKRHAEQELQDLIIQSSLVRSENKGWGMFRSFARWLSGRFTMDICGLCDINV